MFQSPIRNLILPQFEHSRLAGMLAWHWGNADFDPPALAFDSFARGVSLHDWHYGWLDNHPLGETSHAEWLTVAEAGVAIDYADPVTDVIAKYHLRRLIGTPKDVETENLLERLEAKINSRTNETPYPPAAFEWANQITRFCDSVAFNFGFEKRGWHKCPVCADNRTTEKTEIAYEIAEKSQIRFKPWPFSSSDFSEQVMTFPAEGYPERLEPQVVLVRCVPAD